MVVLLLVSKGKRCALQRDGGTVTFGGPVAATAGDGIHRQQRADGDDIRGIRGGRGCRCVSSGCRIARNRGGGFGYREVLGVVDGEREEERMVISGQQTYMHARLRQTWPVPGAVVESATTSLVGS